MVKSMVLALIKYIKSPKSVDVEICLRIILCHIFITCPIILLIKYGDTIQDKFIKFKLALYIFWKKISKNKPLIKNE